MAQYETSPKSRKDLRNYAKQLRDTLKIKTRSLFSFKVGRFGKNHTKTRWKSASFGKSI